MRALWIVAMLLAGCTAESPALPPTGQQGEPEPPAMNATVEEPPAALVSFSMTNCRQLHGVFPAQAADFEGLLPEDFALAPGQAEGLVDVMVYVTACDAGRVLLGQNATPDEPHGDMWVMLPVVPPAEGDERDDYLVMESFVDQTRLEDALLDAGAPIMAGAVTAADIVWNPSAGATVWSATRPDAAYSVRTTTAASGGTFQSVAWRYWLAEDQEVVGIIELDQKEAADGGVGSAVFESTGATDAPPVLPGIAHRIYDFSAVGLYAPIETVDWFTTTA